jgi:hypothetical protein
MTEAEESQLRSTLLALQNVLSPSVEPASGKCAPGYRN